MKRDVIGAAYRAAKSLRLGHRARGDAARDAGNWFAAIDAYEAHLASHDDDTAIWVQLGHACKEAGVYEDAEQAYLRAQALAPLDADILLNIGHLQKVRGKIALALDAYDKAASLQPELFGGAAMIEREQILGRMTWRGEGNAAPDTLPDLIAAIDRAEHEGRRVFQDYYGSFEKR